MLRRKADESEYEEFYKNEFDCDLLIIDNMQFIAGKSYTQEEFAVWFLRMLQEGKSVVVAFDRPTRYYDELLKPLFSKGVVLTLNEVDSEFKDKYLCALLTDTNVELPEVIKSTLVCDISIPYYSFHGYLSKVKFAQKLLGRSLTEEEFLDCLTVYKHS